MDRKPAFAQPLTRFGCCLTRLLLFIGLAFCWLGAAIARTPVVTGFVPSQVAPGDHVTLSGSNFAEVVSVQIGGTDVQCWPFLFPPSLEGVTLLVPWSASSGVITVRSPRGSFTTTAEIQIVKRPAPIVTQLSPNHGAPGDQIVIWGTNLVDVVSIAFNGLESPSIHPGMAAEWYYAIVPTNATTGPLTVTTRTGTFVTQDAFTVDAPPFRPPVITQFDPAAGSPGTSVVLSGTNLVDIVAVEFNGAKSASVGLGMLGFWCDATVPKDATSGPITIRTRSGSYTTARGFSVLPYPPPSLDLFSPASAGVGAEIMLEGLGLARATEVSIGGVPARFYPAYPNLDYNRAALILIVPTNSVSGLITVQTPEGTAVSHTQLELRAEPRVFGFDVSSGLPGTVVHVLGAALDQVTSVALGDAPVTFTNDTSGLRFVVPSGASSGRVRIATATRSIDTDATFFVRAPADSLDHWNWRGQISEAIYDVAYGNGLFVAVQLRYGDRGGIITSPDGARWTERFGPQQGIAFGIAFGAGQFVAVGDSGNIISSSDGVLWTRQTSGVNTKLTKVAFGDHGFVAIGAGSVILHSIDATKWETGSSGITQELSAVAAGNGIYVAGGDGNTLLLSEDGSTWRAAEVDRPFAFLSALSYGNGRFVGVGNGFAITSLDGQHWVRQSLDDQCYVFLRALCFGGRQFVAVSDFQGTTLTSPDGSNWQCGQIPVLPPILALAYGQDHFVAVGQQGALSTSKDGNVWQRQSAGNAAYFSDVAFGNGSFVAVGDTSWLGRSQGRNILLSSDGALWSAPDPATRAWIGQPPLSALTFDGSQFVGLAGVGDVTVASSQFGSNWTEHAASAANASIAYANGVYVTVGSDLTNRSANLAVSADGSAWTIIALPFLPPLHSVCNSAGIWVAVGDAGTILRSTDAVRWDTIKSGTNALFRVTFGANQFVAVGDVILRSPDGFNWSLVQSTGSTLRGLAYGDEGFVAAGDGGALLSSLDGAAWKVRNSGVVENLRAVAYGAKTYVIVGDNGVVLQSDPENGSLSFDQVRVASATLQAAFRGDPAQKFIIESSTNLVQWAPLSTDVRSGSGSLNVKLDAQKTSRQFFRAVLVR